MCPLSVAAKSGATSWPLAASEAATGFVAPLSSTTCSDSDATDITHTKDLSLVAVGAPPGLSGEDAGLRLPRGSAQHGTGKCEPCFWHWKPQGCAYGAGCDYCHSCPEGEVKARRKARLASLHGAEGASISLSSAYQGQTAQAQEPPLRAVPSPPAPPAPAGGLSVGSALHGTGECRPCSWFHRPGGCQNGKDCRHCHLCPEGEIKARRRHRLDERRRVDKREKESGSPPAFAGASGLPKLLGSTAAPPSPGSAHHGTGLCRPYAFFLKPQGCGKGALCQHRHLCPDGELMARRRMEQAPARKASAAQAARARAAAMASPMSVPLPQDFCISI